MSTEPELRIDYYRALVREPPTLAQPDAHLVWVRLMARVLVELNEWVPNFTLALVSTYRSLDMMRAYCTDGAYERSFERDAPHPLGYLEYVVANEQRTWLTDLARCEAWANCLRGQIDARHHEPLRKALEIRTRNQTEFALVSHDALESLQRLVGYADMGISRAGHVLWYTGVPPVYPVLEPQARPGIVVFVSTESGPELRFIAAD